MKHSESNHVQPLVWTVRSLILNVVLIFGILALFYATDHKPLAMRLMRTVDPLSSLLPSLTQHMRVNLLTVRLYDFFVVLTMVIQGCVVGSTIDLIRWLYRRKQMKLHQMPSESN